MSQGFAVKIGLIVDLSTLISKTVEQKALNLKEVWGSNWDKITNEQNATDRVIQEVDLVRSEIKLALSSLN